MEPRVVKPPGQDFVVERLKSRYGLGGSWLGEYDFSTFDQANYKRRSLTSPDDLDTYSSGDKVGPSLRCYSDERKHCTTPFRSSFKHLNVNCLDDELDFFHDPKKRETEDLIENDRRVSTSKVNKQSFKETEKVALPNTVTSLKPRTEYCNDAAGSPLRPASSSKSKALKRQSLLPHQINQIYDELFQIHLKLQCETAAQQKFAEELQKRERFLVEREQLLFRHENALSKIKGVEDEVLTRFQIIKEQHDAEVEHLTEVLKEKNKESKRLKSSFDSLKELNDNLKKQAPFNGQVYELLTIFMEWISDHHLSKVRHEEYGIDGEKPLNKSASQRSDIQEKCVKLLPVMTEQLQWMPFVNAKFHEPFIKFIYWCIRQLDGGTQHSTMTSTLRRLGEDVFKGVVTKGVQDDSSEHSVESKPKTATFFKSSNLPLRFLSTLIVLKTVTQESLQPFLEACSNSLFFRTCSVLLRTPKLDLQILEKLSIILQKLSKINSSLTGPIPHP